MRATYKPVDFIQLAVFCKFGVSGQTYKVQIKFMIQ